MGAGFVAEPRALQEPGGIGRRGAGNIAAATVPLDNIVQDWQYWGTDNHYWNSTEFGNPTFPKPRNGGPGARPRTPT
ncbi:MAG: hypothetical protein WKG07_26840 [Hymenobacter sp.]